MSLGVSVSVVVDPDEAKLYYTIRLVSGTSDEEKEKDERCSAVDANSQDDEAIEFKQMTFTLSPEDSSPIEVRVLVASEKVILSAFSINDIVIPTIHLDFPTHYGVHLNASSARECSADMESNGKENHFDVTLTFVVSGILDDPPEPCVGDKDACDSILQLASIDIMSDWIYCHEHHHHHSSEQVEKHEEEEANKPELKPTILSSLEQIVYLLTLKDSPKILLESILHKDYSIFLEFSPKYLNIFDEQDIRLPSDPPPELSITLPMKQKFLVSYKIFNKEEEEEASDDIIITSTLLKSYRMSFEVEWIQIEHQLYQSLAQLLLRDNKLLKSLSCSENDLRRCLPDQDNSVENKEDISLLCMYTFQ